MLDKERREELKQLCELAEGRFNWELKVVGMLVVAGAAGLAGCGTVVKEFKSNIVGVLFYLSGANFVGAVVLAMLVGFIVVKFSDEFRRTALAALIGDQTVEGGA